MIAANELRIGDYILRYGKISKVTAGHLAIMTGMLIANSDDIFTPVVITDKILVKLGFEWSMPPIDACWDAWTLKEYAVINPHKEFEFVISGDKAKYIKIQHVHQLQNLYFALCGEELTIKE